MPEDQTTPQTSSPEVNTKNSKTIQKSRNFIPTIIILSILVCVSIGLNIFFGIQNHSKGTEISNLTAQLSGIAVTDQDTSQPVNTTGESNITTKQDILAQVSESLSINCNQIPGGNQQSLCSINDNLSDFLSASWNFNDNTGTMTISWDTAKNAYGINNNKTGQEHITDFGPQDTVTDMVIGQFGQNIGQENIFFLMQNGTIEYIPIAEALKTQNFHSHGTLDGIDNVIKISRINWCPNGTTCSTTTIAQRADGTIYNLADYIQ